MITHLEKVEGKSSSFNIPNDSIPIRFTRGIATELVGGVRNLN
jgi:hypothetical protein